MDQYYDDKYAEKNSKGTGNGGGGSKVSKCVSAQQIKD